jgi:glycosyltransferase involved in cell wall biosynthesis
MVVSVQETFKGIRPQVIVYADDDDKDTQKMCLEHTDTIDLIVGPRIILTDTWNKCLPLAKGDILMILDADLTTPPEELPKFYNAIAENKAEFVNGSRLVYPMEKQAMRFFNILANKFFAAAFSFVLGQRFKDTLCGTKVLSRVKYQRLAATREFFGDFDPFVDFDLLFGAARMGLKIVEIPIHYHERTYGTTNIQRWHHGLILLRMLMFAARRMKFLGHETLHPQ